MRARRDPAAAGHLPLARRLRRLSRRARIEEARAFLRQYHEEAGIGAAAARSRLAEAERALRRTGTYVHTPEELSWGARIAWRNHSRCIGRLLWRSLELRDRRHVTDPDAIAGEVEEHMRRALNGGRVRSVITVFAPVRPGALPAHLPAEQVCRYAGHIARGGDVVGDRAHVEATRQAEASGWRGDGTPFDLLPVPIVTADGRRVHRALPADAVRRVPLRHPAHDAFSALRLEWYAVPCITGMILTVGGIDYPCAPFNGFYMSTEIASRNLVDPWRYDMLEPAARSFGLDPEGRDPLWRDRALTELNAAVIHSFAAEGVTLIDHHAAARDFMRFRAEEAAHGRKLQADWGWIVPPQAAAATPPFHLEMDDGTAVPNYYRGRTADGWPLMPYPWDRRIGRRRAHLLAARRWIERRRRRPGA
jgi:nitric-oxide synthase